MITDEIGAEETAGWNTVFHNEWKIKRRFRRPIRQNEAHARARGAADHPGARLRA